ncbi:MAG TPA: hypothetical protein H9730_03050 [Candidatus Mediterraneibacter stercoripullorum]|nr:hypothetical protein [Candidatus Mediterraneibacter stercoripullorum]
MATNKYTHNPYDVRPWPLEAILPPPYDGTGSQLDDISILSAHVKKGDKLPRIYLAIGTEDFIYEIARIGTNNIKILTFLKECDTLSEN